MLKLSYIREFITLAETLSFSHTAELSFITQPALSRHIVMLEEELGGKLVNRTTRSVSLTPAGKVVYDTFNEMLSAYYNAQREVALLSEGKMGTLKICSPYYWTGDYTEPIAAKFVEIQPDCNLEIISCQPRGGLEEVIRKEADLCITVRIPELDENIRRVKLTDEPLAVMMTVDHPLAGKKSLQLQELAGNCFVTIIQNTDVSGTYNDFILKLMATRSIYPEKMIFTQQIDTLGLDIQRSGGISIMPYGVRHMDRDYLKVIPLAEKDCVASLYLYYRIDNQNPLIPKFVQTAHGIWKNT